MQHPDTVVFKPRPPVEPYDYREARHVNLDRQYARGRNLKDETYRQMMDSFTHFVALGTDVQKKEALRRIKFIEDNLLNRDRGPELKVVSDEQ